MRVAFTIIYNGLHHLKHRGYAEYLARHLDYWVFVDGLAGNKGSTSWCKNLDGAGSTDGTVEYLEELQKKYPQIILQKTDRKWPSKDAMVNRAIELVREKTQKSFLWQVDADEQWSVEMMVASEIQLVEEKAKTGTFHSNYYLGEDKMAYGMWGEGVGLPYVRLWDWRGEYFLKHEPPVLLKGNGKTALMPYKFNHYAYYFAQDVEFKSKYYSGHEKVFVNWQRLQEGKIRVPCDLRSLFGHRRGVFQNTVIRAI